MCRNSEKRKLRKIGENSSGMSDFPIFFDPNGEKKKNSRKFLKKIPLLLTNKCAKMAKNGHF